MIVGPGSSPIAPAVWQTLETDVKQALEQHLVGRRLVDFDGPHGLDFASQNLGTLLPCELGVGVSAGLRASLPLLELRIPFELPRSALEARERGAPELADDAARDAARRLAELEDQAIFTGLENANIRGLLAASSHDQVPLGAEARAIIDAVARALLALDEAAVDGPYAVVLGDAAYRRLASGLGYPPLRQLEELAGGRVLHSRALRGGLVLSTRGGDFRLTVGQDAAIGYTAHDTERVLLYLVESFTFLVSSPEAVIGLSEMP